MWFAYALSSAFIYAFRGIFEKLALAKVDRNILGLAIRLYSIPFFCIPFLLDTTLLIPISELDQGFWLSVLYIGLLAYPLETYFYYRALEQEEVSLVLPILSVYPVMATILAMIFLKEIPGLLGVIGVLITTMGVYFLKIKDINKGIFGPLISLKNNTAIRYMLIVAFLISVGTIVDKIALAHANVYIYGLLTHCLMVLPLTVVAVRNSKKNLYQLHKYAPIFAVIGLIVFGYTTLFLLALQGSLVGYASAIKATSILLSIAFGVLFLKEKNLVPKLIGGSIILLGIVFIKLA